MSYGVDRRHGLDLALLWLWCRPAAAAPIQCLAWKLPYAPGAALKRKKKKKRLKAKYPDFSVYVLVTMTACPQHDPVILSPIHIISALVMSSLT